MSLNSLVLHRFRKFQFYSHFVGYLFQILPLLWFFTGRLLAGTNLISGIVSAHNYIPENQVDELEKPIMNGTVKSWKMSYGFIETEESKKDKKDVFVHESDIQSGSHLVEGTKVKFDLVEESRGPKAVHVEIIE